MTSELRSVPLDRDDAGEIVAVLAEAFYHYPVMQFVLGAGADYDRRLSVFVKMVIQSRLLREEPMLGVRDSSGALVGAAVISISNREPPDSLIAFREQVWQDLGQDARSRYETYGTACAPLTPGSYHHHLNMIGVRRSRAGSGLGRLLLEAVHEIAQLDRSSAGVSLSTEVRGNVDLYRHFGYEVTGEATVREGLMTWGMFRKRPDG